MELQKMSQLQTLIAAQLLNRKVTSGNAELVELLIDNGADIPDGMLKNVCAKLPAKLADRIDTIVLELGISKRKFIQYALYNACIEYENIYFDLDMDEVLPSEDQESEDSDQ